MALPRSHPVETRGLLIDEPAETLGTALTPRDSMLTEGSRVWHAIAEQG
jgi:hypothetical protein